MTADDNDAASAAVALLRTLHFVPYLCRRCAPVPKTSACAAAPLRPQSSQCVGSFRSPDPHRCRSELVWSQRRRLSKTEVEERQAAPTPSGYTRCHCARIGQRRRRVKLMMHATYVACRHAAKRALCRAEACDDEQSSHTQACTPPPPHAPYPIAPPPVSPYTRGSSPRNAWHAA